MNIFSSIFVPSLVTYRVPVAASLLAVGGDWPGVQTLLVPQLARRLDGLTELSGRGLAVKHVAEEGVLRREINM